MVEGRPRVISRIADKVSGILLALNPSNEGGRAISDVLFGDYNPNGKLPFTYPRSTNNYLTYDHKLFEVEDTSYGNSATSPQFNFGSGMSYTTFEYGDLTLDKTSIPMNGEINVSFTVKNTGSRAGKETAILYLRDEVATLSPAGKRVRRFAKVNLDAGQSKTLTFKLNRDDFSYIGMNNKPIDRSRRFYGNGRRNVENFRVEIETLLMRIALLRGSIFENRNSFFAAVPPDVRAGCACPSDSS